MYADNELLFPPHAIPHLKEGRGDKWRELVEEVMVLPEDNPRALALSLTMIRLDGCMTCETDSYRAMRGCIPCALQTLRRFKGSDEDLLKRYQTALEDVKAYLEEVGVEQLAQEAIAVKAA